MVFLLSMSCDKQILVVKGCGVNKKKYFFSGGDTFVVILKKKNPSQMEKKEVNEFFNLNIIVPFPPPPPPPSPPPNRSLCPIVLWYICTISCHTCLDNVWDISYRLLEILHSQQGF